MTNEQILKKAIEKAVKNGWDNSYWKTWTVEALIRQDSPLINVMLLSHDFAKAFWGEEPEFGYYKLEDLDRLWGVSYRDEGQVIIDESKSFMSAWQYHLQQMVLEEEPLKYIEKFF